MRRTLEDLRKFLCPVGEACGTIHHEGVRKQTPQTRLEDCVGDDDAAGPYGVYDPPPGTLAKWAQSER